MLKVALLALLVLPIASADHAYSHRFVLDGRLVGSDGLPLPGRTLEFFAQGEDFLEPCREGMSPITDEFGDFRFCYHKHDLKPATKVGVRYGNVSIERTVDVATRRVPTFLREPNETGIAPPNWSETYRISGRAWRPGPIVLEGVQVFGEAVIALPVNLTIHFADGSDQVFRSSTDGYGDYDLVVETPADPSTFSVAIEARGRTQPVQLDAFYHRSYAPVFVTLADAPPTVPTGGGSEEPVEQPPGNTTPRVNPVLVVAVVLALVLAIVLSRRKSA
jgi:hypothetical protein